MKIPWRSPLFTEPNATTATATAITATATTTAITTITTITTTSTITTTATTTTITTTFQSLGASYRGSLGVLDFILTTARVAKQVLKILMILIQNYFTISKIILS